MEKRRLGKTDLQISVVGFGGIPIQRYDNDTAYETLAACKEYGINFIDSARAYGVSEEYIGNNLKKLGRETFYLASKSLNRTKDGFYNDILTSLKNFKTDVIDLYQIHNVGKEEDFSKIFSEDGAYEGALKAQKEGKIRFIGITSHIKEMAEKLINTEKFATLQFPFNIVENQGLELFKRSEELDMGTIAMKPLGGGILGEVADNAIQFIVQSKAVTVAIPGMNTPQQVEQNVLAAKAGPLTEQDTARMQKLAKEIGKDFCRRCGYCLPCTVGIDIPGVMVFEGYIKRYGLSEWAKGRYETSAVKASECIECNQCMSRCPYGLMIPHRIKWVDNYFAGM
jgi:predicted aldo/keto reductase-like oxidoreductase